MTFDQITAAVKERSKRTQSTTLIEGNNQLAVDWLSVRYDFPELQTTDTVSTTASAETTAVPSLFKAIYDERSVTLHETGKLEHLEIMTPGEFFQDHPKPDEDTEDEPTELCVWGNEFLWYPVPDDAYSIRLRHILYHDTFDDNNVHSLGEECDRAIIAVSTAMTYEAMMELEDAQYWYNIAISHMADVMSRSQSGIALSRPSKLYRGNKGMLTPDKTDYRRVR
jgi:hypothetical protein